MTPALTCTATDLEGGAAFLRPRHVLFHTGSTIRHFRFGVRAQIAAVLALAALLFCGIVAGRSIAPGGEQVEVLQAKLAQMENKVKRVSVAADARADRVERRQQFLAAVVSGEGDPEKLAGLLDTKFDPAAVPAAAAQRFAAIEARQGDIAAEIKTGTDAEYRRSLATLRKMGVNADRFARRAGAVAAMGGPFEPINDGAGKRDEIDDEMTEAAADMNFRSLFKSWKRLDALNEASIAIPSLKPVENLTLTSSFGVRSDPFKGTRAMHAGLDIPGAVGTPVYATADGIVGRSGRYGAYGNLIEVNHGKGIQTRYGHLSRILVGENVRVTRGQLIGMMGSTGRSTGPHLHYEVRVEGRAINPMPFLQTTDYLVEMQAKGRATPVAMGGPVTASK